MTRHATPSRVRSARDLVRRFEQGRAPDPFDHAAHVHVAWAAVRTRGPDAGAEAMLAGLRRVTAAAGVPEKLDERLTREWMALVAAAVAETPDAETFAAFIGLHPQLLDAGNVRPGRSQGPVRRRGVSSLRARPTRRTAPA